MLFIIQSECVPFNPNEIFFYTFNLLEGIESLIIKVTFILVQVNLSHLCQYVMYLELIYNKRSQLPPASLADWFETEKNFSNCLPLLFHIITSLKLSLQAACWLWVKELKFRSCYICWSKTLWNDAWVSLKQLTKVLIGWIQNSPIRLRLKWLN